MEGGGRGRGKAHRHQLFHLDESLNTAMESLSIYSFTVHWVPAAKKRKQKRIHFRHNFFLFKFKSVKETGFRSCSVLSSSRTVHFLNIFKLPH